MGSNPIFRSSRSGGIGRRDSLKNCWGATPMSVRARPSALKWVPIKMKFLWVKLPSCVVVAQGTLDPLALVRIQARQPIKSLSKLLSNSLSSRRQGLSKETPGFYWRYLSRAASVVGLTVQSQDIAKFLECLSYSNDGRHAYFRALRAFYNWLYSPKSGYSLNLPVHDRGAL